MKMMNFCQILTELVRIMSLKRVYKLKVYAVIQSTIKSPEESCRH